MFALFEEEQIVSTEGLFGWSLSYASDTDASFFFSCKFPPLAPLVAAWKILNP